MSALSPEMNDTVWKPPVPRRSPDVACFSCCPSRWAVCPRCLTTATSWCIYLPKLCRWDGAMWNQWGTVCANTLMWPQYLSWNSGVLIFHLVLGFFFFFFTCILLLLKPARVFTVLLFETNAHRTDVTVTKVLAYWLWNVSVIVRLLKIYWCPRLFHNLIIFY